MGIDMNRVFGDFDDADPTAGSGGGNTIKIQGTFKVRINNVFLKESDQYNTTYFIVEFTVLESSSDKIDVGTDWSWAHDILNKWYGAANTKQFIAAAVGLDPASADAKGLTRQDVEDAVSDDQPLTDRIVMLKTQPKKTKNEGRDFTVHNWGPVE